MVIQDLPRAPGDACKVSRHLPQAALRLASVGLAGPPKGFHAPSKGFQGPSVTAKG